MLRLLVRAGFGFVFTGLIGVGAACSSHSSSPPVMAGPGSASLAPAQPAAMSVPGVQRTATAADALHAMSQELSGTRQTVGETLASLKDLAGAQGDLLAPFD